MKRKLLLVLSVVIVISLVGSLYMTTLNAGSSTHEAENSNNKLKYAKVNGGNVEFESKKDAYVEMKKVNSPSSGSAQLTFYYSASKSFPLELKVNGDTICSKDTISTSGKVSYTADMKSGSDNKVRFKIRDAVSGIKLDKVVISTDGSSSDDSNNDSNSDSNNDSNNDSDNDSDNDSSSGGSAEWKKDSKGTIIVESGTFDGGGKSYGGVGDGSQNESQPPVFTLRKGTNLKNVKITPPAGDGIHVEGNNKIEKVNFTDVGEDAISMGSSSSNGGTVTVKNCQFSKADDKVFQVNRESKWYLYDITVDGAGKVMRQNGGKTFPLTVYIDGLNATGVKEAIVRSDASKCTVYYKNIKCNLSESDWWLGELTAKKW